jgi:hypothetical protein
MKSLHEQKIKDGVKPLLEPGEEVLAAFIARPRGWTQAMAGARNLGVAQQGRAHAGAAEAEFELASPMALAVTQGRLLTISIGSPIGMGIGGKVKSIVAAAPLSAVDAIEVKRLALGYVVEVTVRGVPFKLEANALAGVRGVAEVVNRERATV